MPKITWEQCDDCIYEVKQNGCGSDLNALQRMLTRALEAINPVTVTLFRPASDKHDIDYHKGDIKGIGDYLAQKEADDEFLQIALFMVENPHLSELNRFNQWIVKKQPWYFRHKSYQYYDMVRRFGHLSFGGKDKLPCNHPDKKHDPRDVRLPVEDVEITD
jgi:hypothetical protein